MDLFFVYLNLSTKNQYFMKGLKIQIKNLLCISLLLFGFSLSAQPEKTDKYEISIAKTIHDSDIVWNPAPDDYPGCFITFLHGDIAEPNLDFFFRIEPNTEVIYHTHNSAERMILLSGELEVQYEGEKSQILKPGTYAYGPAKKPHRAKCLNSGQCVLFVAMNEPFTVEAFTKKE